MAIVYNEIIFLNKNIIINGGRYAKFRRNISEHI